LYWRKPAYRLSGIAMLAALVIILTMDWVDSMPADPDSWGNIASELLIGVSLANLGMTLVCAPNHLLKWLAKHVPFYRPPAEGVIAMGFFLLFTGGLFAAVGICTCISRLATF